MSQNNDILNLIESYYEKQLCIEETFEIIAIYSFPDQKVDYEKIFDFLKSLTLNHMKRGNIRESKLLYKFLKELYNNEIEKIQITEETQILESIDSYYKNQSTIEETIEIISIYLCPNQNANYANIFDILKSLALRHIRKMNSRKSKLLCNYLTDLYKNEIKKIEIECSSFFGELDQNDYMTANQIYKNEFSKHIENKSESHNFYRRVFVLTLSRLKLLNKYQYNNERPMALKRAIYILENNCFDYPLKYEMMRICYYKLGLFCLGEKHYIEAQRYFLKSTEIGFKCYTFTFDDFGKTFLKICDCVKNVRGHNVSVETIYYLIIDFVNDINSALNWLERVNLIENHLKDNMAESYYFEALILFKNKQFSEACDKFKKSLVYKRRLNKVYPYGEIILVSQKLVLCLKNSDRNDEVIDVYKKLIEDEKLNFKGEKVNDLYNVALVMDKLGIFYLESKNYEQSQVYFGNAIQTLYKCEKLLQNSRNFKALIDLNLSKIIIFQNMLLPYEELNQSKQIQTIIADTIKYINQCDESEQLYNYKGLAYFQIAENYAFKSNKIAIKYYNKAIDYFNKAKNDIMMITTYTWIALNYRKAYRISINKKSKDYNYFNKAFEMLKKLISFSDKHINEKNLTYFNQKVIKFLKQNTSDISELKFFIISLLNLCEFFYVMPFTDHQIRVKYLTSIQNFCKSLEVSDIQYELVNNTYYALAKEAELNRDHDNSNKYLLNYAPSHFNLEFILMKALSYKRIGNINEAENFLIDNMPDPNINLHNFERKTAELYHYLALIKLNNSKIKDAIECFEKSKSIWTTWSSFDTNKIIKNGVVLFEDYYVNVNSSIKPRGICFICNALEVNTDCVESTFNYLKYDIKKTGFDNNSLKQIQTYSELANYDVFVMIVFAFGMNDKIKWNEDEDYSEQPESDSIAVQFFNNENCKFLTNKPKIFVFNILDENIPSLKLKTKTAFNRQIERNVLSKHLNNLETVKKEEVNYRLKTGDIFIHNLFITNKDFLQNNNGINNITQIIANYQKDEELLSLCKIDKSKLSHFEIHSSIQTIGWTKNVCLNLSNTKRYTKENSIFEKKKRLCVILDNFTYDWYKFKIKNKLRDGNAFDVNNIAVKFLKLHYQLKIVEDQTGDEMKTFFKDLANDEKLSDYESIVLFILTHGGSDGVITGIDEQMVNIHNDILFPINSCKYLSGKPKVIVIQACRGGDNNLGDSIHANNTFENVLDKSDNELSSEDCEQVIDSIEENVFKAKTQFKFSDMFVWYSTLKGYVSYREPCFGTLFINSMIRVMNEYNDCIELLDLTKKTNQILMNGTSLWSFIEPYGQTSQVVLYEWNTDYYFKNCE